jgi:hypothetical protein
VDDSSVLVLAVDEDRPLVQPFIDAIAARGVAVTNDGRGADVALLIASPHTAASRSVDELLVDFVRANGPARVLLILVAGDIAWNDKADRFDPASTTALSPATQPLFTTRPLWLDAREGFSDELAERVVTSLLPGASRPPPPTSATSVLSPAPPPARRSRRWLVPVVAALASLVVASLVVFLLASGRDEVNTGQAPPPTETGTTAPGAVPTTTGSTSTTPAPTTTAETAAGTSSPPTTASSAGGSSASPLWFLLPGAAVGLLIGLGITRVLRARTRPAEVQPLAAPSLSPWPAPFAAAAGARPTVFISHNFDTDHAVAVRLADDLRGRVDVWLAPESIQAGEAWLTAIERGLKVSAVFLALLSRASLASPWVVKEIQAAMELEVQHRLRLVPVQIEECEVPLLLRTYQIMRLAAGYPAVVEQTVRLAATSAAT